MSKEEPIYPESLMTANEIERAILKPIYHRRFVDRNFFMTAIGGTGSGKSTLCLKFLEKLQVDPKTLEPNFDPREQVVFTVHDFIERVRTTNQRNNPGFGILFDEIEIEGNSIGFDTLARKLAFTVSTMRFKKNLIFASMPIERQLLKQVRTLRDARANCLYVDWHYKTIVAKYQYLNYKMTADTDDMSGNDARAYNVRYQDYTPEGYIEEKKISHIYVKPPSKKIEKVYKKMKEDFLHAWMDKQLFEWKKDENKQKITYDVVAEHIDKHKEFLIGKRGSVNATILSEDLNIPITKAREYARMYSLRDGVEFKKLKSKTTFY